MSVDSVQEICGCGAFSIVSLNVSEKVGTRKSPVRAAEFVPNYGIKGDAHAGKLENRQISLLAIEEIEGAEKTAAKLTSCGETAAAEPAAETQTETPSSADVVKFRLSPGDFGENITTRGLELHLLPLGTHLYLGPVELVVSQIGKECHASCEIRKLVGDCVMPRRGIFARVVAGGEITNEVSCRYRV